MALLARSTRVAPLRLEPLTSLPTDAQLDTEEVLEVLRAVDVVVPLEAGGKKKVVHVAGADPRASDSSGAMAPSALREPSP